MAKTFIASGVQSKSVKISTQRLFVRVLKKVRFSFFGKFSQKLISCVAQGRVGFYHLIVLFLLLFESDISGIETLISKSRCVEGWVEFHRPKVW